MCLDCYISENIARADGQPNTKTRIKSFVLEKRDTVTLRLIYWKSNCYAVILIGLRGNRTLVQLEQKF